MFKVKTQLLFVMQPCQVEEEFDLRCWGALEDMRAGSSGKRKLEMDSP